MRHLSGKVVLVVAATAAAVTPVASQAPAPPTAQKPSFEVTSVKPNKSGPSGTTIGLRGNVLYGENVTLRQLLQYAYVQRDARILALTYQIIGGPTWMDSDRFDVQAKFGDTRSMSSVQIRLMAQSLLEDRFQLRGHQETRELPVYNLVIAKSGKLKSSSDQSPPDLTGKPVVAFDTTTSLSRGAVRTVSVGASGITISATAIPMSMLITTLQQSAGRRIIDKTGVNGLIDVNLQFSLDMATAIPPASSDVSLPPLVTALQEQLGLKLESAKGPVEVLVIDSVQKPSEN